jgi:peroxiredoxin
MALVLAGCSKPSANASTGKEAAPAAVVKRSDGPAAPDWALETLDGDTFRLADHRGDVVVMFFMASWCGTCVPEAQALAELYREYGQEGLTVVAINVEPEKKVPELTRFRQLANNGDYFWVFDTAFQVTQLYNVKALDTTIIIDRTGHIAYRDGFPTPKDVLEPEIQKWL